jgi:hypothetical protein
VTESLLAKILGGFTVKTSKVNSVHLMLMENTHRLKDPDKLRIWIIILNKIIKD